MEVHEERIGDVWEELDELVKGYYKDDPRAQDGMPPLDFNWPIYDQLNHAKALRVFTVRVDNHMMGFVMYHVFPHLHYKDVTTASCDILGVRHIARGLGVGRALVEHAEHVFRELGVRYMSHMFRVCYDTKPLFPKLGFKLAEQGYLKELL